MDQQSADSLRANHSHFRSSASVPVRLPDFVPPPSLPPKLYDPYRPWPTPSPGRTAIPPGEPELDDEPFTSLEQCVVIDEVGPDGESLVPPPFPKGLFVVRNTRILISYTYRYRRQH